MSWPPKTAQELISEHEGRSRIPYRDTRGFPTCGIGHKLSDDKSLPLTQWGIATDGEIDTWFVRDCGRSNQNCQEIFGAAWPTMTDARRAAFIDMAFQLGGSGLAEFKNMIAAAVSADWAEAARQAKASLWDDQAPHRAAHDEALILFGDWSVLQ